MSGFLFSGGGSLSTPIIATGTTTARSIPDRLADIKNVKDFGATGDGTTDDTAAIQATVNWQTSNGNRASIYFPAGRYIISSAITLPQGSFHIYGDGNASAILCSFNGFVFDNLTNPYGDSGQGIVIERLNIQNTYAGQNPSQAASGTWAASGSPVTINVTGLPSSVAANCLVYVIDGRVAPMPVFVGIVSSVVAGTSITLASTAIGSNAATGNPSNLNLAFVQAYAASASWINGATTITMPGSPPAGVPTNCLVYDYDRILAGDTQGVAGVWTLALGVGNWSGSTVTFTAGVSHASIGSADKLIFAPLAGCVRLSSSVTGTVRDNVLNGFIGVTTSQDNFNTSGQQLGAEAYTILVQENNISAAGHAAAIGGTAVYLTNNSLGLVNDYSGFWIGTRISGIANSVIGGRFEVCTFGIVLASDQNTGNEVASANVLAGFSMESNVYAIFQGGGGHCQITSITILCQNAFGKYGILLYGGDTIVSGCSIQGNWSGYGVHIPDTGNTPAQITFISTDVANNTTPSQGWRIPAQSWWGTCIQCNNPALVYTYANLKGISTNPAAVEGEEFNISDGTNGLTWGQTVTNTGTHTTHYKVRYNGANWTVMGV